MKRNDSILANFYYKSLPKAKEGGNYFNKYKVPTNDEVTVRVDPILKFFNGGFLMPAQEGGNINFPKERGYTPERMVNGGNPPLSKSYNPNLGKTDKEFLNWYKNNTLEGQKGMLYNDPKQVYDFYSYFKSTPKNQLSNPKAHFPDTFKYPNHPTFSNESIYSTPENPGGYWEKDRYFPKGKFMYNKQNGGDISIPDLRKPNWLKKFAVGGEEGPGDPPVGAAEKQFITNWNNSAMAQQMLKASVDKDDPFGRNSVFVEDIKDARNKLTNQAEIDLLSQKQLIDKHQEGGGDASPGLGGFATTEVTSYPKAMGTTALNLITTPALINMAAFGNDAYANVDAQNLNTLKPKIYTNKDDVDQISETNLHELSHASDLNGKLIPTSDIKKMNVFARGIPGAPAPVLDKFQQYVAEPTETRARLNNFRFNANNQKLYDPFNQKVTIDVLKKYKGTTDGFDPLQQLRAVYSDQEIVDMLNSVSKAEPMQPRNADMAKYGGWIDKYVTGGKTGDPNKPYNAATNPTGYVSMKNNKDWFDSHANWSNTGNNNWDAKVRQQVMTGRFGVDPNSGALIKLPQNEWTNVSAEDKRLATDKRQWTPKQKQTSWEKQVKPQIVQSTKDLITNPVMMAPGAILTGGMASGIPAISRTLGAIAPALNTPIAGIAGATPTNAIGSYFAADALVNRLPQIPGQISQGDYAGAAENIITGGMDIAGANMISPFLKGATELTSGVRTAAGAGEGQASFIDGLNRFDKFSNQLIGSFRPGRKKAIAEGNQWMDQWIQDPATQTKIDDAIADLTSEYQRITSQIPSHNTQAHRVWKDHYDRTMNSLNYAKNYKGNSKEYPLLNQAIDFVKGQPGIHEGNWGISYGHGMYPWGKYNGQTYEEFVKQNPKYGGSWISRTPGLSNAKRASTTVHEDTHEWIKADLMGQVMREEALNSLSPNSRALFDQWESLKNAGKSGDEIVQIMGGKHNAHLGYLGDPTEIHARIMELRKHYNMNPSQIIDPKKAAQIINDVKAGKTPVDRNFSGIFENEGTLANAFNKLWAVPVGLVAGQTLFNNTNSQPAQQKYGGESWLNKYPMGGPVSPSSNAATIPGPAPTPQTGSSTQYGPTFSDQSGYTPPENKREKRERFMLDALKLGVFMGGILSGDGKDSEEEKRKKEEEKEKNLLLQNSDQNTSNKSIGVDGNGNPLPGIAWNYNPAQKAQEVDNPFLQNSNPGGALYESTGMMAKLGGDVSIYGRRNYRADTPTFFAPGGTTEGGCPSGWMKDADGNCVQDPEARKTLAKKAVEIARQRIKENKYYEVPEDVKKAAEAQGEGAYGCIGGVCSVYTDAGIMSRPNWSNTDFALHAKEYGFPNKGYGLDQLRYLEPGDALQYYSVGPKNYNKAYPHHSQLFLGINEETGEYEFFDNYAKSMRSYSKEDMEDLFKSDNIKKGREYGRIYKVNPYNPAPDIKDPVAKKAYEDRLKMVESETSKAPTYEWSISENSAYKKDPPIGMKKFVDWANNESNINQIVKALGVPKSVVYDEMLNTFGELGQENKWDDRWFGGDLGIENTYEKIFKPKNKSIGPGQIKFNSIPQDLKDAFGIKKAKDLYNWDKVLPVMTAINIRNRQWMERKGTDLSKYFTGEAGVSADEIKYGIGRWTPYMYRGLMSVPKTREQMRVFDDSSYANKVFENIDKNIERKVINQDEPMPAVVVESKKKQFGGMINGLNINNNNWLKKYNS